MKTVRYANLTLNPNASITNIGDWVQLLAVDNIYKEMGVKKSEIFRLPVNELSSYRGDTLVLPINFPMFGIYDLSPDIVPVYLGISVIHNAVVDGLRMREFGPVGCRDNHTYNVLSEVGIDCYHAGCLSITFPRRRNNPVNGKVYLIGLSDKVYENLPKDIIQNAVRGDHVYLGGDNEISNIYTVRMLNEYRDNAALVVTSKIHCVQPCIAMGIPVVFICDEVSFRYEVISRYISIYTIDDLINERINWAVQALNIEEKKSLLVQNAIHRIKAAYNGAQNDKMLNEESLALIQEVDDLNKSTNDNYNYKIDMIASFEQYLKSRFNSQDAFKYAIWGVSQFAYAAVDMVMANFPNAILDLVVDEYKRIQLYGKQSKPRAVLKGYKNVVLFTVPSATGMAQSWFEELGVKNYVISYGGVKIIDGNVIFLPYNEGEK